MSAKHQDSGPDVREAFLILIDAVEHIDTVTHNEIEQLREEVRQLRQEVNYHESRMRGGPGGG